LRGDVRFLEAEVKRALKDVCDVVEHVLVLNTVVQTTLGLGLGRAIRGPCSRASLVFWILGLGLFLPISYAGNFGVRRESFCSPVNPPSVQDVATEKKCQFSGRNMSGSRRTNFIKNSWSSFSFFSWASGRPFSFFLPLSFVFFFLLSLSP
jgi:hypothetical protein